MSDAIDPDQLLRRRLGFLMRDSARLMRRRFIQRAREAGLPLNQSEATALVHIAQEPGLQQVVLAERLEIEPIVLVRLLDRLQQDGLIERRDSKADRRVRTVWPTAAALPMLNQIDVIRRALHEEALLGLSDDARQHLVDSLLTIRTNLSSQNLPALQRAGSAAL